LGVNGDYYLDDLTGAVYLKASGAYSQVATLKGARGPAGPPVVLGDTRPTTPALGTLFYNTTARALEFFDGTDWRELKLGPSSARAP
jgi:hypothetical protein